MRRGLGVVNFQVNLVAVLIQKLFIVIFYLNLWKKFEWKLSFKKHFFNFGKISEDNYFHILNDKIKNIIK